jgi:hypothetical protein
MSMAFRKINVIKFTAQNNGKLWILRYAPVEKLDRTVGEMKFKKFLSF